MQSTKLRPLLEHQEDELQELQQTHQKETKEQLNDLRVNLIIYSDLIHSFITDIFIPPLQVHYYSDVCVIILSLCFLQSTPCILL